MSLERICPVCGGSLERRRTANVCESDHSAYGEQLSLGYICERPECGFGVAFPFDGGVYCAYACEEIRRRTRSLPADERAGALLDSIAYCRRGGDDVISRSLLEQVNTMFMEALGEILKDSRVLLRALSYREPNAAKRRETRQRLLVFLRFLSLMEGRYPTQRLEAEFLAIRDGLAAIDYYYELGMLALESDIASAEEYFEAGSRSGGIRSRVAYLKYILAEKAESDEDRASLKEQFAALAECSQDACLEYMRLAEVGTDDISAMLKRYEEAEYPSLSIDGRLAFIRLELTACIEYYEPALAQLSSRVRAFDLQTEEAAFSVLRELSALTVRITDQCAELFRVMNEQGADLSVSDPDAEISVLNEESALLEYVIGCCMYFRSCFDAQKRFDIQYLREASGHLSCFLASELVKDGRVEGGEIPSLIGFLNLRGICETARSYRHVMAECAGFLEEAR